MHEGVSSPRLARGRVASDGEIDKNTGDHAGSQRSDVPCGHLGGDDDHDVLVGGKRNKTPAGPHLLGQRQRSCEGQNRGKSLRSAIRMRRAVVGMETAQSVVAAMANAVEAKDLSTELHYERLASMTARLGSEVGLPPDELEALAYGSLLHDVGKIGIPEAILSKAGTLTADEWTVMRRHPEIGERICRPLTLSRSFAPIVRHHHEQWDGAGYPDGLAGDAIPLGARIVALADSFDAMTHDRPYRGAMPIAEALSEIARAAGRQFDPGLAPLFLAIVESDEAGPAPSPAGIGSLAPVVKTGREAASY